MRDGAAIAHFWSFNAQCLCLTIDAFAGRALVVNDVVERAVTVEQGTHESAFLDSDVLDTAFALDKLGMRATLAGGFGEEQGTAIALTAVAVRMPKLEGGLHAQIG